MFLVDKLEHANVGMARQCRQAKHATWTVVDMAMGIIARVHFNF
jgi:hypothetical protein